jgi:hypothetical protein
MLSQPDNLACVQADRRAIEAVGRQVSMAPPSKTGLILVTLRLPGGYRPEQFLTGLPFYLA